MIPKEVLKNVRRIQIVTSHLVTDAFAGQYHSVFKGKGMEFEEVREYLPGDEVKSIDWNVTARMGRPYVKKFTEERELTVMLLLDVSRSIFFGTVNRLKSELAAEICAVLAFSAIKNNDKVGLIKFTDRIEKFIPPRKGVMHILRVIREAIYSEPKGYKTDITKALDYLNRVTKRKCVAFIISDFYASNFKQTLAVTNKRHDVIAVTITDPIELELPSIGIVQLEDAETGSISYLDTSDRKVRDNYRRNALQRFKEREEIFKSIGIDYIDVRTNIPYLHSLIRFFQTRQKRLAIG